MILLDRYVTCSFNQSLAQTAKTIVGLPVLWDCYNQIAACPPGLKLCTTKHRRLLDRYVTCSFNQRFPISCALYINYCEALTFHVSGKHFLMSWTTIGIPGTLIIPSCHCCMWLLANMSELASQLLNNSVCRLLKLVQKLSPLHPSWHGLVTSARQFIKAASRGLYEHCISNSW